MDSGIFGCLQMSCVCIGGASYFDDVVRGPSTCAEECGNRGALRVVWPWRPADRGRCPMVGRYAPLGFQESLKMKRKKTLKHAVSFQNFMFSFAA